MDGVVAIVALVVFIGVWWWLVKQMRKSGRGFLVRHVLGCAAGWMASLLVAGVAVSMGIIEAKPQKAVQSEQPAKPAIKYTIVKDDFREGRPRKVEVMLTHRLTDSELAELSKAIRDDSDAKAEKTFIGFRVEGQTYTSFWANVSFEPEYKSNLIGLSHSDYQTLIALDLSDYTEQVGSWLRDGALGHVMVLYKKDGNYFMDSLFASGGRSTKGYAAKLMPEGGLRLEIPNNKFGEYYILQKDGSLEGWGESGMYLNLRPLRAI